MGNLIFFFCIREGENEWGEIYTSLLALQVCFAHLLRSQGDKTALNHLIDAAKSTLAQPKMKD
jgi:hypothetical protein